MNIADGAATIEADLKRVGGMTDEEFSEWWNANGKCVRIETKTYIRFQERTRRSEGQKSRNGKVGQRDMIGLSLP